MSDDTDELFIFDSVSSTFVDVFKAVLMLQAADTHIPELYDIFGKENFLKFLDIFSGMRIDVPNRDFIQMSIRDTTIYVTLRKTIEGDLRAKAITELAIQYELRPLEVRDIYYDLESKMARFSL